jgi:putative SOS response-associated peptidase YedK
VVPTSGFYEWSDVSGARSPYFVPPEKDSSLLWLAGLASRWKTPEGEPRWTYAVLTESSDSSPLERYHDRMPVTLAPDQVKAWLHSTGEGPGERDAFGRPYRVSKKVNSAAVNEPSNLEPVELENS